MLKISKLTDYATAVILFLQNDNLMHSADIIAKGVKLEVPTVSKVLKLLTKAGLLSSTRGINGGYQLAKVGEQITLFDVIQAIEGNPAITECTKTDSLCAQEQACDTRTGWQKVNQQIQQVLVQMTIARMAELNGASKPDIPIMIKDYV